MLSVFKSPSSFAGSQSPTWASIGEALALDGNCAISKTVSQNSTTNFLKFSEYDFASDLPADAIISGIKAHITARNEFTSNTGFFAASTGLRIMAPDVPATDGRRGSGTPFTSDQLTTKVIGGDTDTWGIVGLTAEQVRDTTFGIYANFTNGNTAAQEMFLDCIQLEIFYTMPEPEQGIGGNGPVKPE